MRVKLTKLTKGIEANVLLCLCKHGILDKDGYVDDGCCKKMTGRGPNIPRCRKLDNSTWVGK